MLFLALLQLPQVCIQGIPWKFTWKELKELVEECGEVERADVMTSQDGRSKVRLDGGGQGDSTGRTGIISRAACTHTIQNEIMRV